MRKSLNAQKQTLVDILPRKTLVVVNLVTGFDLNSDDYNQIDDMIASATAANDT